MCYVAAAVALVAAAAGAIQQQENQRKQFNYQRKVVQATEQNTARAAAADYVATAERVSQVQQAAAQEAFDASQEAQKAQSSLIAGAQAAGLGDGVVMDISTAIANQAAQDLAIRERNATWEERQLMRSLTTIQTNQQSRLNSATPTPIPGIDYGSLLGGLTQGAVYAQQGL